MRQLFSMRFYWLLMLPAVACTPPAEELGSVAPSIIGGVPAAGAHPAVGLVVDLSFGEPLFQCTGTLIAPDAVLTAAHCVFDPAATLGFVLADDFATVQSSEIVTADEQLAHPFFLGLATVPLGAAQAYDVGLLLLSRPITAAAPIPIASPPAAVSALTKDAKVVVVGAGLSSLSGQDLGERRLAEVSVTLVADFEVEVAATDEPQPCSGDSGGPLLREIDGVWQLLALVSRNKDPFDPCRAGTVATRIAPYLDFISKHVTLPCGSGEQPLCVDAGNAAADAAAAMDGTTADGGLRDQAVDRGVVTSAGPKVSGSNLPTKDDGCALAGGPSDGWWIVLLGLLVRRQRRRIQKRES